MRTVIYLVLKETFYETTSISFSSYFARMLYSLYLNNRVLLSKALSCDRLPEEI